MKQATRTNKSLIFLVVILLLSNIAMLIFLLSGNRESNNRKHGSVPEYVKKSLGLSDEQAARYGEMYQQHRDSLQVLGETLRNAKFDFFRLLQQPAPDSLMVLAAARVSEAQMAIELNNFRHFQRVRSLCNDTQKVKFDSLMIKMVNKQTAVYRAQHGDSAK